VGVNQAAIVAPRWTLHVIRITLCDLPHWNAKTREVCVCPIL